MQSTLLTGPRSVRSTSMQNMVPRGKEQARMHHVKPKRGRRACPSQAQGQGSPCGQASALTVQGFQAVPTVQIYALQEHTQVKYTLYHPLVEHSLQQQQKEYVRSTAKSVTVVAMQVGVHHNTCACFHFIVTCMYASQLAA